MVNISGLSAGVVVNITPDTPLISKINRVEVLAVGGYKIARTFTDVDARHAELYSSLETPDVPDDVRNYNYVIITNSDGMPEALADAWLRDITVVNKIMVDFSLELDSMDELERIRRLLNAKGFSDVKINVTNN